MLLSAHNDEEHIRKGLELGAARCLAKPVRRTELMGLLQELVPFPPPQQAQQQAQAVALPEEQAAAGGPGAEGSLARPVVACLRSPAPGYYCLACLAALCSA